MSQSWISGSSRVSLAEEWFEVPDSALLENENWSNVRFADVGGILDAQERAVVGIASKVSSRSTRAETGARIIYFRHLLRNFILDAMSASSASKSQATGNCLY
jgi:hypothetical protein